MDIKSIYTKILADVLPKCLSVITEPVDTIEQCCINISQKSLDGLNDEDFAKNLYFKFLDRPPTPDDIKRIATRLTAKKSTRAEEISRVMASSEYATKNIKCEVV